MEAWTSPTTPTPPAATWSWEGGARWPRASPLPLWRGWRCSKRGKRRGRRRCHGRLPHRGGAHLQRDRGGPLRPGVGRNPPRPERLREKPHGPHPGKASREDAGAGLASRDRAGGGLGVAGPARALGQASLRRGPRPRHPLRRGRLPRGAGDGEELAAGRRRLPPPGGAGVWALQGGLLPRGRAPRAGEVWRSPLHAKTLREIAGSYGESLYRGALAEALLRFSEATGGSLPGRTLGPTPRSG